MKTYCNPLNLNYRLQQPNSGGNRDNPGPDNWWFREAADPSVVIFGEEYYLFSSVTKGYWVSPDLCEWEFIALDDWRQLPNLRHYAPTAVVLDDIMYLAPGNSPLAGVFKTATPRDPSSWVEMPGTGKPATGIHYPDAQFFYDSDFNRLYYIYGCSPDGYLHILELNRETMRPEGFSSRLFMPDPDSRGWERPGGPRGNHDLDGFGWVEGGQMFKHNGRYYWIYSLPDLGNAYCNSVYVADDIAGPYTLQRFNPCTQKLTGFAPGSGHGEIFQDKYANWWTATCQNIWKLERFERRISLFPTRIGPDGELCSDTRMGDYPIVIPDCPLGDRPPRLQTGWNLLSYRKPVTASSELPDFPAVNAVDEDIRTWWSAASGAPGEWLQLDLSARCEIRAVQVNFAEQDIRFPEDQAPCIQYRLLGSDDGLSWRELVDKSDSNRDAPHDYIQFPEPVSARHIRLVNVHMPFGGNFAIRGLRLFGCGNGTKPEAPAFTVVRNGDDPREALVRWDRVDSADGYVIRYGLEPDELFHSQQIYGAEQHLVRSLNRKQRYCFTVDVFNADGYGDGTVVVRI